MHKLILSKRQSKHRPFSWFRFHPDRTLVQMHYLPRQAKPYTRTILFRCKKRKKYFKNKTKYISLSLTPLISCLYSPNFSTTFNAFIEPLWANRRLLWRKGCVFSSPISFSRGRPLGLLAFLTCAIKRFVRSDPHTFENSSFSS